VTEGQGGSQFMKVLGKGAHISVEPPPLDFAALYETELTHVWHTLRRSGVHARDLEDVCHDVFVAFYRGRERFDPERPIRPWLSGIAFRVASDYRRRAQHRRELPGEPPVLPAPGPGADERLEMRQEQDLVLAALAALDEGRRAVLVMHDLDEQAMPEIAAALELPLNTAYSRLRLARADFAAAVKRLRAVRRER
jgi:RNA polymerase sigma-70 factor (ECF subfamily)